MGSKTRLPDLQIVQKWTNQDLTDWLKQSNLSDCIPVFLERNIDGAKLLDMPSDKIITELADVRIKQRMQVAKCVTECKSQAAEAKKVVGGLSRSKKKRAQVAAGSAGEPDDFDSDGWSSNEFDTDDEEEEKDYSNTINGDGFSASDFASDNVSTNGPESVASSDSSGQYNDVALDIRPTMPGRTGLWNLKGTPTGKELDTTTPEPSVVLKSVSPLPCEGAQTPPPPTWPSKTARSPIPKPPSTAPHQLGKLTPNGIGIAVHRRSVPRLQRPPSQPPAPPSPKSQAEPETPMSGEEEWDYEVPIPGIPPPQGLPPSQQVMVKVLPSAPLRHPGMTNGGSHWNHPGRRSTDDTSCTQDSDNSNDLYEPVDQPKEEEETYEEVNDPVPAPVNFHDHVMAFPPTPCLPPRKPASLPPHLLIIPPLPEKPSKMVTPPIQQPPAVFDTPPVLPSSKGLSSSKSMSQLVNKFRYKLGGRRGSGISSKDVEAASQAAQEPTAALPTPFDNPVTVNGTSLSTAASGSVFVSIPGPPPLPPMNHPFPQRPPPQLNSHTGNSGNFDSSSMTLRPLPPVPSSPDTSEERLDLLPYYVDMERDEAVLRLFALQEEDVYLVRPSRRAGLDNPYTLTLIHMGKPFHLNIRLRPDRYYALGRKKDNEMVFESVSALVSHHQRHPIFLSAHGTNVGTSLLRRHL